MRKNLMSLQRCIRANKEFMAASNIPGVDPALIHRHAYRVRRIVVELVNKLEYLASMLEESHEKKQFTSFSYPTMQYPCECCPFVKTFS